MKKKLLYIASTYSHIRNFHLPYLLEFQRRGWEVHVGCGGSPMELPGVDRVIHIPFSKQLSLLKNREALVLLRRLIREEGYTLISTHTALASFFVRLALLGLRERPLVACMVHGYLFDDETALSKRLLLSTAEKLTAPVTDLLMTMNAWDADYAQRHQLGKLVVNVPGIGVPLEKRTPADPQAGQALRQELGLSPEQYLYIYAAEFSARKDQATLIRAMEQLPESCVLALPGSGALWESCRQLSQQLGLQQRVLFPGQVSQMAPWYAAADAAVSSSRSEGLPFNIMEAMYQGLPIAATAVKGHLDLIRPEHNGLLFPFGDVAACAQQLRRLREDDGWAQTLGAQARRDVQCFSLEQVLPQVMALYQSCLPQEEGQEILQKNKETAAAGSGR